MSYFWPTMTDDKDNVHPIRDEVFIKVEELADVQLPSGLWLPQSDALFVASDRGTVMAVGPGKLCEDGSRHMPLKPGDRVLYIWQKGCDYQFRKHHYIMLSVEHILGVLEQIEIPSSTAE